VLFVAPRKGVLTSASALQKAQNVRLGEAACVKQLGRGGSCEGARVKQPGEAIRKGDYEL